MRRIATLLLPLAALSACATAGVDGVTPLRPGFESGGTSSREHALRVRLTDLGGDLRVQLNRRAHVAVFQVLPGEGVALVSPFGVRETLSSGHTTVATRFEASRFWRYDDAFRRQFTSYGPFGTQSALFGRASYLAGPRHLLVVASDRPLRVARFAAARGMLRRVMGTASYTSQSSRQVMDDLLATVLEPQPESSWDADVLTIWPLNDDLRLPGGNLHRIRCRGGATVWVPLELMDAACRDPERVAPPLQRPDSTGGRDSARVREPGGRRPQPEPRGGPEVPRIRMAELEIGGTSRPRRQRPEPEARERPFLLSELREDLAYRRARRGEGGERPGMTPGAPRVEHVPGTGRIERPQRESAGGGNTHQAPRMERPSSAGSSEGARPEPREKPQRPERSGEN
ncbi:MAG TPA: hypothetical protein VF613_11155 [Longimicrobium sp.]|jgi:hypothetical protein